MLQRLSSFIFLLCLSLIVWSIPVSAALPDVMDKPAETVSLQPPLIITAFGGGAPDFFEIYNQTSQPVNITNGSIEVVLHDTQNQQLPEEEHVIMLPHGWLLPKQYLMLQRGAENFQDDQAIRYYKLSTTLPSPEVLKVSLVQNGVPEYSITPSMAILQDNWVQHRKRTNATLKISNEFLTDYTEPKNTVFTGYADALYTPPSVTSLKILEVLPNARDCSPLDSSATCGDYIKLYNPTNQVIDMTAFQLRTDSGGMKSSATNTITLAGDIAPGAYYLVQTRDNGEKLSLTNTGGYVWLEDRYGVVTYEQSIVSYPDASSVKLKGMSWALRDTGHVWEWMLPRPDGANAWEVSEVKTDNVPRILADCGPGKYRNPDTNRCRNITTTNTSLTPCKPGQVRNPETNRCRSGLNATTSPQACGPGKYRNPETNRCKNIMSVTSGLKPCKPGQERNPDTNRCRKAAVKSKDIASITDHNSSSKAAKTGWWVVAIGVLLGFSYGVFEWRQDITRWFKRRFLGSS